MLYNKGTFILHFDTDKKQILNALNEFECTFDAFSSILCYPLQIISFSKYYMKTELTDVILDFIDYHSERNIFIFFNNRYDRIWLCISNAWLIFPSTKSIHRTKYTIRKWYFFCFLSIHVCCRWFSTSNEIKDDDVDEEDQSN